jgi:hypothetical protein
MVIGIRSSTAMEAPLKDTIVAVAVDPFHRFIVLVISDAAASIALSSRSHQSMAS